MLVSSKSSIDLIALAIAFHGGEFSPLSEKYRLSCRRIPGHGIRASGFVIIFNQIIGIFRVLFMRRDEAAHKRGKNLPLYEYFVKFINAPP